MKDPIERQDAIDAVSEGCQEWRGIFERCEEKLLDLPSAQPELCEEAVSRQAVSSWLKQYGQDVLHGKYKFSLMYIWKNLMGLPSVTPKQRWIPCSEGLPKKDGRYQVTRYDYVTNTEFIDILWYEKNIWWNGHQMGDYAVTAWMSLPEPYKAGNEEV